MFPSKERLLLYLTNLHESLWYLNEACNFDNEDGVFFKLNVLCSSFVEVRVWTFTFMKDSKVKNLITIFL